jgi:hypothetical protein
MQIKYLQDTHSILGTPSYVTTLSGKFTKVIELIDQRYGNGELVRNYKLQI